MTDGQLQQTLLGIEHWYSIGFPGCAKRLLNSLPKEGKEEILESLEERYGSISKTD